jgi:hypothetical protein
MGEEGICDEQRAERVFSWSRVFGDLESGHRREWYVVLISRELTW